MKYPAPPQTILLDRLPWNGEIVVCVASGPSAKDVDLTIGRGRAKFITVNDSWRLCTWADAMYACDPQWWLLDLGLSEGPPTPGQFAGIRITQDVLCARQLGLRRVTLQRQSNKILNNIPGLLGWGGNSGFHTVNIAAQSGAARIILVGYDYAKLDENFHWHKKHQNGLHNPSDGSLYKWRLVLDEAAPTFKKLGIEVINCSPISTLKAYPKMTFKEALEWQTK